MSNIDFYFDFTSPYSYLLWCALTRDFDYWFVHNTLNPTPIMAGRLFSLIESTGPGEIKSKREYLFKDCLRKAKKLDIQLRSPARMPFSPLPLLRMAIALKNDKKKQIEFIGHTFSYGWKEGHDYEDHEKFKNYIVENCDITQDNFLQLEEDKGARRELKLNIKNAVTNNLFGVPSLVHEGELFWGLDSIEFLKEHLDNINIDYDELERFKKILKGENNV